MIIISINMKSIIKNLHVKNYSNEDFSKKN